MASQLFPDIEQVLDILMSELPDGVYAEDRADDPDQTKRSYSSSELRAHAQIFANLYESLSEISDNKTVTTVRPSGLAEWEKELFAAVQDSMLPIETRKQNLLSKLRALGRISLPGIADVISGVLGPLGIPFAILPYGGQFNGTGYGAWIFEFSQLGFDTYLAKLDPLIGAQQNFVPLDCSLNYVAAGITLQDLLDIQATAYTYEVDIYGNADTDTLNLLDRQLTALEPARSTHIIRNNATPPP